MWNLGELQEGCAGRDLLALPEEGETLGSARWCVWHVWRSEEMVLPIPFDVGAGIELRLSVCIAVAFTH